MFDVFLHTILHSLLDALKTLPIIFVCYLVIELLEEKILTKYKTNKFLKSKFAPVLSASFGIIPQCGFSVVATDLYSKKLITLGSLMAIYLATSDEALPILLSTPNRYLDLLLIIGIKFVYAVIIGLLIDAIFSRKKHINTAENSQALEDKPIDEISQNDTTKTTAEDETKKEEVDIHGCCNHDLKHKNKKLSHLFLHPLLHSLKIFAFIFVINIIFGLLIEFVGEDAISNFMTSTGFFEPFIVALVGLIPNCAASVIITELFLIGGISLGSVIAGLCVNSGIALILLFRLNKNIRENILILVSLYLLGVVLGVVINLF